MDRNYSPWHALRVRPRFENVVTANLSSHGLNVFSPVYVARRHRDGRTRTLELPLFPGYVLCRLDPSAKRDVMMSPGVLYVADAGQCPAVENEVAALQSVIQCSLHYEAGPLVTAGRRVQVIDGPLKNVQGILVGPDQRRLALPVSLLQRSVLVDLAEGMEVAPVVDVGRVPVPVSA